MSLPSSLQLDKVWKIFMPVFVVLFGVDQLSKAWALENLIPGQGVNLGFSLSYNYGVVFGIQLPQAAIYALSALVLGIGAYLVVQEKLWRDKWHLTGLAFILAGGIGNLVDRLRFGYVVDFIQVYFWPTFNLADVWIVLGVVLFTWIFVVRDNP